MSIDGKFLAMLDKTIGAIAKYSTYAQYQLYKPRYDRMIREINDIKKAVSNGKLARDFDSLEITKMLDMNDPDEIKSIVLEVNQFYRKNYTNK